MLLSLRYGAELEDEGATLESLRLSDRATLDLALRKRTAAELDAFARLTHVLVQSCNADERAVKVKASTEATVAAVKASLKVHDMDLCFSPVFSSTFGQPLAESVRPLGDSRA